MKKNSGQKVSLIIFHALSHRSPFFRESHSESIILSKDVTIFHIGTINQFLAVINVVGNMGQFVGALRIVSWMTLDSKGYLQMLISHTVKFCSYDVVLFSVRSKEGSCTCFTSCFVRLLFCTISSMFFLRTRTDGSYLFAG